MRRSCQWYDVAPEDCGHYDSADFRAMQMCCACERRQKTPVSDCKSTSHHIPDAFGDGCSWYDWYEDSAMCGPWDSADFQAMAMCCGCGGGTHGDVCPHDTLSALPDMEGLCQCGPDNTCEDDSQPGQGCPALPGQRSMTHFEPKCGTCRCVREAPAWSPPLRDEVCTDIFSTTGLPDTPEAWMVFGVLQKIRDSAHGIARAATEIHDAWLALPEPPYLLAPSALVRQGEHKWWAKTLFRSIAESDFSLRSCGVYLPSTGVGMSLENGGCKDHQVQRLLSSANSNQRVHSYEVRGIACKSSRVGPKTCFSEALWLEGWSYNDTMLVHQAANGSWDYGVAPGDVMHEGWFQQLQAYNLTDPLLLDPWSSSLDRVMTLGFGIRLVNPSDGRLYGLARCAMSTRGYSNLMRTLVGAGARIFLSTTGGALFAASRGGAEIGAGPNGTFARALHLEQSGDPVIRHVGTWLVSNARRLLLQSKAGTIRFPYVAQVQWPEMKLQIRTYVMATPYQTTLWVVYMNAPQCGPGYEMITNSTFDVIACTRCPPGRFSDRFLVAGDPCPKCGMGSYAATSGSTRCTTCAKGEYQQKIGATECEDCPANTTSVQGAGSLSSCRCQSGFFSLSGELGTSCKPCPTGASCEGQQVPPIPKMKYYALSREVSSRRLSQNYIYREFIKCSSRMDGNPCKKGRAGGLTPSGHVATENVCEDGYEGVACSHCSKGYYRFGRDCMACGPDNNEDILRFYWVLLIVLFYLLRRVVNSKYKTLYIFLSFLQVFGLQTSFSLAWPSEIKYVMRIIQVANLQVDLLMPSCGTEPLYFYKYLMYLAMPFFFFLVDLVVILISRIHRACARPASPPPATAEAPAAPANQGGGGPEAEEESRAGAGMDQTFSRSSTIGTVSSLGTRAGKLAVNYAGIGSRSWKELIIDFMAQFLCNMRLMYLSLCGRSLDMVQCTYFVGNLPPRLSKDMNIICWEGIHSSFMPIAGLATVVYILGTPLAYMIILFRGWRSNVLYSPGHLKRYGLLYSRFEPSFFFYELVIMLRRVLAVVIKTVLNVRTAEYQRSGYIGNYQAGLMAAVMVVSLAVHFYARPFSNPYLDIGDACYLGATFMSCILGMCFSSVRKDDERRSLTTLWFLNLALTFAVTFLLVWRDIEVVHPRVHNFRKRTTDRMGIPGMAERLKSGVRRCSGQESRKWGATEVITGINYEILKQKPALVSIFKSVLAHSIHEKLEHLGIVPQDVYVLLTEGPSPDSVVVRTNIVPPSGISPAAVQKAMSDHSQADLAHTFMEGLKDAIASRPRLTAL